MPTADPTPATAARPERGSYAAGRTYPLPAGWRTVEPRVLEVALERTLLALDGDALERLAAYYRPEGHFAGALVSTIDPNPENEICAADLLAVSMLSIEIPQLTARQLLDVGQPRRVAHHLLSQIPYGLSITALDTNHPEVATATNAMWDLHNHFRTLLSTEDRDSNRWVFAAKLCARKRPWLFPVRDNLVCTYLAEDHKLRTGRGLGQFDVDLQVFAFLMSGPRVAHRLAELRAELQARGYQLDETDLRLLDVALWTAARSTPAA
ncbi:DUF6308 family protein [Nocardioides sp. MAHUQ-72]|uniref:DUF6308 family protein n=1 Tax=unclassified Nocardioides TaxID=2615069 RepID=UPI00361F93FB